MELAPAERIRFISAAAQAYCPDFLLTAGHAIHTKRHLEAFAADYAELGLRCTIITEVTHDLQRSSPRETHAMYAVSPDGRVVSFGRQVFATRKELHEDGARLLSRFDAQLPQRTAALGDWNVFALICGEINVIEGRDNPRYRSAAAEDAILAADIVFNPTHDRMGNAGTLDAKRRLLSRQSEDGRNRVYVSCSNWEACGTEKGRRQYPSPTLQTVYAAGAPVEPDAEPGPIDEAFQFQYRHWSLDL